MEARVRDTQPNPTELGFSDGNNSQAVLKDE